MSMPPASAPVPWQPHRDDHVSQHHVRSCFAFSFGSLEQTACHYPSDCGFLKQPSVRHDSRAAMHAKVLLQPTILIATAVKVPFEAR